LFVSDPACTIAQSTTPNTNQSALSRTEPEARVHQAKGGLALGPGADGVVDARHPSMEASMLANIDSLLLDLAAATARAQQRTGV